MARIHRIGTLLIEAAKSWRQDHAQRLGAALAYYAVFSVAPLILIAISIASFAFEADTAKSHLLYRTEQIGGPVARNLISIVVSSAAAANQNDAATATLGAVLLVIAAAGIFSQLKGALNVLWHIPPHPHHKRLLAWLLKNLFSFLMVVAGGAVLMASILLGTIAADTENAISNFAHLPPEAWQAFHVLVILLFTTLLFACMYKFIPDVRHSFKSVLPGAAIAAVLFTLGKFAFTFYLNYSSLGSAYGAAGSLIVFLLWLYYSAQIFLYGAEYAKISNRTD